MKNKPLPKIIIEHIELIKFRCVNTEEFYNILGISYLIATIHAMNEIGNSGSIFSNEDYLYNRKWTDDDFDERYHKDGDSDGFSKKFLLKRLKKFCYILEDFSDFKQPLSYKDRIKKIENDLENRLDDLKSNGKIEWLNKNGLYSFYESVRNKLVVFSELGEYAEGLINHDLNIKI